ncbi:MAG TPA: ABC transporter permease [Gammaproteobacteria bacterium]|nr:ABC transporter permease [Gammaproteobacteria bacterium]
MLKLALRNLFRQGTRTLLTLFAVIFGVTGLILGGGFIEGVLSQLREGTIHSQLGHLQIARDGYAALGRREPFDYLMPDPAAIAAVPEGWPGVLETLTRLSFTALANNGRADLPVLAEGVQPDREVRLGSFITIVDGRHLRDDDAHGVVLGKGVARFLKLAPGDPLTLIATTPDGAVNSLEFRVVGIFQSFSRDYDDRALRIPLAAAQELLVSSGAHVVVLSLADTALTEPIAARLAASLPAGHEVKRWHELADFYQKTEALYRQQFGVLQFIVLIMVLLSVANSVNMAIFERTGEFGTLLALGQRRGAVFRLIMLEYVLLGAFGALVGLALGILAAIGITALEIPMPPQPGSDVSYNAVVSLIPGVLIQAFLVGWLACVVAAFLPGRRASKLPVVEALRANI